MNADEFWQRCLRQLRREFDQTTFNAFIEPVSLRQENDALFLVSPNRATERWLRQHVDSSLRTMMTEHFDGETPDLSYRVNIGKKPIKNAQIAPTSLNTQQSPTRSSNGLRQELSFDSFVQGDANEIAFVAAKNIARGDDQISPLFIFGNTGLGKTHLAQAAGNDHLRLHPRHKALYISAHDFLSEVVSAFRLNQHDRFRERFHSLDMLIIDDIQHLGGNKTRTQETFFHLFNALHENGKKIIIAGDRSPAYLKEFPDYLRSRFGAGVSTRITPPGFDLRVEILRQKAKQWKAMPSEKVIRFVAENIQSSVRELEGALKRILAMAQFKNAQPSVEICRSALSDLIGRANVIVRPDAIKEKVAQFYNVRPSDLLSKSRRHSIAYPRHIAVYLCRKLTTMSLPEIGHYFGKRNHATVLHSCRYVEEKLKENKQLDSEIDQLTATIRDS